jgi:hypothetical protein
VHTIFNAWYSDSMEHVAFSDSAMYKNLDGCMVRDFSSQTQRLRDQDIAIEERYPAKGYIRNGLGRVMVRVLNRHGLILVNTPEGEKKIKVHNGSRVHIEPSEDYAFEGSMDVMCLELPVSPRDTGEYVEDV